MIPSKEHQKIYSQIFKNVFSRSWKCLIDECNKTSINSHLLQQNGILNTVAENGHLYELKAKDTFKWDNESPVLEFTLVGIKKAISLPLFCNEHDTTFFKEVESNPIDFHKYRSQLLLSFRAVCAEIRKKQRNIEIFTRILNANTLKGEIDRDSIEIFLKGTAFGITDLERYKGLLGEEIKLNKATFSFSTFTYPLIKIYGSATFSPMDDFTDPDQNHPLNAVFIHVIPYNNILHVIVGYHNDCVDEWITNYLDSWRNLETRDLENKLTNLFATRIETWGLSPSLYRSIPAKTLKKLIRYCSDNAMNHSVNQKVDFNIFESNNYGA